MYSVEWTLFSFSNNSRARTDSSPKIATGFNNCTLSIQSSHSISNINGFPHTYTICLRQTETRERKLRTNTDPHPTLPLNGFVVQLEMFVAWRRVVFGACINYRCCWLSGMSGCAKPHRLGLKKMPAWKTLLVSGRHCSCLEGERGGWIVRWDCEYEIEIKRCFYKLQIVHILVISWSDRKSGMYQIPHAIILNFKEALPNDVKDINIYIYTYLIFFWIFCKSVVPSAILNFMRKMTCRCWAKVVNSETLIVESSSLSSYSDRPPPTFLSYGCTI